MIIYDFVRKGARSTVGMKVERFGGDLAKVGVSLACITIEDLVKGRTRREVANSCCDLLINLPREVN